MMNAHMNIPAWRSPWVLAAIIMLITVISVNATFIYLSSSTNPGLVTEEYQKYGMQQNEFEIMNREQTARGWQIKLNLPPSVVQSRPFNVIVDARDKNTYPLTGAHVELACYRPSDAKQDISVELMANEEKPGEYTGLVTLPLSGVWDINILLEKNDERHVLAMRIKVRGKDDSAQHQTERSALETVVNYLTSGRVPDNKQPSSQP